MRNMFDEKQRFSLRKLSIGVVSVLLGVTFVNNAQVVQADTQNGGVTSPASSSSSSNALDANEVTTPSYQNTSDKSNITDSSDNAQTYVNNTRQSSMSSAATTNIDQAKGMDYMRQNSQVNPGKIFAGGPQNWGWASDMTKNYKITQEAQANGTTKWTVTFLPDGKYYLNNIVNHADSGAYALVISKDNEVVKDANGHLFTINETLRSDVASLGGVKVKSATTYINGEGSQSYAAYDQAAINRWIASDPSVAATYLSSGKTPINFATGFVTSSITAFTNSSSAAQRSKVLNDRALYMDSYGIVPRDSTNYDNVHGFNSGIDKDGHGSSYWQKAFKMDENNANKNQNQNMWGNKNPAIDVNDFGYGILFRTQGSKLLDDHAGATWTVTFYTKPSGEKVSTYSGVIALGNEGVPQNADGGATRGQAAKTNTDIHLMQAASSGVSSGKVITSDSLDAATAQVNVVVKNATTGATTTIPAVNYTLTKSSLADVTGNTNSSVSSVTDSVVPTTGAVQKNYYISESFAYSNDTAEMQAKIDKALNPTADSGSKYLNLKINNLADLEKAGFKATTSYDASSKQYVITVANADKDNAKYPAQAPATLTVVNDKTNLSQDAASTTKVTGLIKGANSNVTDVTYSDIDQVATLTYADGSTNSVSYNDLVVQVPAKTMIFQDSGATTYTITDDEAGTISAKVNAANASAKLGVKVNQTDDKYDGSVTVSRTSASGVYQTATLTPAQTIINIPNPVLVKNKTNITAEEKQKVVDNLKSANKTISDGFTSASVASDGTASVTFADGSKAITVPGTKTVFESIHQSIIPPYGLVWVKDQTNLTSSELDQVKQLFKDANDGATEVGFGANNTGVTVKYSDGQVLTLDGVRANQYTINYPKRVLVPVGETVISVGDDVYKAAFQESIQNKGILDGVDYLFTFSRDSSGNVTYTISANNDSKRLVYSQGKLDAKYTTVFVKKLVKVADPNNLTNQDKQNIKDQLTKDNPNILFDWNNTTINNGYNSTSTLSFSEGNPTLDVVNSNLIYADAVAPKAKTAVGDPDNLTNDQKQSIIDKVVEANKDRGVTSATVDQNNGKVIVTYGDSGVTETIPVSDTIVYIPARTAVSNKANNWTNPDYTLNDSEKTNVKSTAEAANKGYTAQVNNDGSVLLTDDSGNTATLTTDQTTLKVPKRTVVADKKHLTSDEKKAVLTAIKKLNLDISDSSVIADDGTATVSFTDNGSKTKVAGDLLVYQNETLNKPSTLTPVVDKSNLTPAEISQIIQNVEDANMSGGTTYLSDVNVEKDSNGNNVVSATLPDGTTQQLTMDDVAVTIPLRTVVENKGNKADETGKLVPIYRLDDGEKQAMKDAFLKDNPNIASDHVQAHASGDITVYDDNGNEIATIPADKTTFNISTRIGVKDQEKLDSGEVQAVTEVLKQGNVNVDTTKISVGTNGKAEDMAKVSFTDGTRSITIPGEKLTAQIVNNMVYPLEVTSKTLVTDPAMLTDNDKAQIENSLRKNNPKVQSYEYGTDESGNPTITAIYPDNSKTTIPLSVVVAKYPEKTQIKLSERSNNPTAALNNTQKDKVATAVKTANPNAEVTVNDDGSVTMTEIVTYNVPTPVAGGDMHDPNVQVTTKEVTKTITTTISAPDTVINVPNKVKVDNVSSLTPFEKSKVWDAIKAANPNTKFNGVDIINIVESNGDTPVTFQDGSPQTKLTDLVAKKTVADTVVVNIPSERTIVNNKKQLSDEDKEAVKTAIANANPASDGKPTVTIDSDGNIKLTYSDGSAVDLPVKVDKITVQAPVRQIVQAKNENGTTTFPIDKEAIKTAFTTANPDLNSDNVVVDNIGGVNYTGSGIDDPSVYVPRDVTTIKVGPKVLVENPTSLTDDEKDQVISIIKKNNSDPVINEHGNFNPITRDSFQEDGLHVTYPAGQGQDVVIPYSDLVEQAAKGQDTYVAKGETVNPSDLIANKGALPEGTTPTLNDSIDTSTSGVKKATVTVTYSDGNSTQVTGNVHVIEAGNPVKVGLNHNFTAEEAKSAINPNAELPEGATYSWKTTPDTSTSGSDKAGVVTVTVGDKSVDVPVKVNVASDADEAVTPVPENPITVKHNAELPKAEDVITNKDAQKDPANTHYSWDPENTPKTDTVGEFPGKIIATFPDGSTKPIDVTVKVTPLDNETYSAKGKTVNVDKGTDPVAKDSIDNTADLPENTEYTWTEKPDTSTWGDKPGTVHVTYPDGSTQDVNVTVHVNSDADKYNPTTQPITVDHNEDLTGRASDTVDSNNYPITKIDWQSVPSTETPGGVPAKVVVTYEDGSADTLDTTVNVRPAQSEQFDPASQEIPTRINQVPKAEDGIQKQDKNGKDMPTDAEYSWAKEPEVSKSGETTGVVKVTYKDGSVDQVTVPVKVVSDGDENNPKADSVSVKRNADLPKAEDVITNKADMPNGTTYSWDPENTPKTDTVGEFSGKIIATFPDGSTKPIDVTVKVTPLDNETYSAKGKTVNVDKGTDPVAKDSIDNTADLPENTEYTWTEKPDTSTWGDKPGTVHVTYPDGSTQDVNVTVHVNSDADKYNPTTQPITVDHNEDLTGRASDTVDSNNYPITKIDWQSVPSTETPGGVPAKVVVTYEDGSADTLDTTVNVRPAQSEQFDPASQEIPTRINQVPKAEDGIQKQDKNGKDMPTDAEYSWAKEPEVSKSGETTGVVKVTYKDGSVDQVTVPVKVVSDGDENNPKADSVSVKRNADLPKAEDVITNKADMPNGTTYSWDPENTPKTDTVGEFSGKIIATFPDGST
ncbi:Rib/alpha-like domain-containing protein, partial [Lactobacillus psittaci]|uniref:Rib/alpha-like domain-containing protein n=1 Tax=Lactobacillus psittaci TaxID=116089 RepID=UPI0009EB35EE